MVTPRAFFFWGVVNTVKGSELSQPFRGENLGHSCGKSSLAMVYVADGTYVDVRFCTVKALLSHSIFSLLVTGAQRRDRTADPVLTKNVLYP